MIALRVFALALAGMATAGAITIADGSFESPIAPGTTSAGSSLGAWSVTSGNVLVDVSMGARVAQSGSQFAYLPASAIQNVDIEQTISGFVPGVDYEISYWICGYNPQGAQKSCAIEIAAFNHKADSFTLTVPASTTDIGTGLNPWVNRTFTFPAEGESTKLQINNYRSAAATDAYAAFDNFTIRVVPKGRPVLTVTSPRRKKTTISRSRLRLAGTASATLPLVAVRITSRGRTSLATGTTGWSATLRLRRGVNRIGLAAVDLADTRSADVVRIVRRVD
jgi:hypothetical protein